MKGLQLCEAYYRTHGERMLEKSFPDEVQRMAVGLAGPGSECFGFDDEISRDHDWGPSFCLWLTDADMQLIGPRLAEQYAALPPVFMGYGPRIPSPGEEHRVGPCGAIDFFQRYLGSPYPPEAPAQWLRIPEDSLAMCTNGEVWVDPLGDFTRFRSALLAYYPEDVRLKKIASRCITVAQAGQYNFSRSLKRGQLYAIRSCEVQFCTDVISLAFLFNRRYTPYFKWALLALKDLPLLGSDLSARLEKIVREEAFADKEREMQSVCEKLASELTRQGLSDSRSEFLLDHVPSIYERIVDPQLRGHVGVVR